MENLIEQASEIYDYYKKQEFSNKLEGKNDEIILDHFRKKYVTFSNMFPVVLRYMVQLGLYNRKAFTRFIKKLSSCPPINKIEYCKRRADYVKYLYIETSKDKNTNNHKRVWTDTFNKLKQEVDYFNKAEEKTNEQIKKNNKTSNIEKREELKKQLSDLYNNE